MNRTHFAAAALALAAASCSSGPAPNTAASGVRVYENFTLIDGSGRDAVANAVLVVAADGRIQYAGPKAGAPATAGAERSDWLGKFVMPGVINLHSHLGNVKGVKQDQSFYTRENLMKQLGTYAKYGVTGLVSMGGDTDNTLFDLRESQRTGRASNPRVWTAGRGMTGLAGYPISAPGMKGVPYELTSDAEVEKAVAEQAARKVDLIKVWVDDHLGKEKKISTSLVKAIIANASKHGLKVAAHIFYHDDAMTLSEAGLYAFAHSVRDKPVSPKLVEMAKKQGTWQIATLTREVSTFVYAKPHAFLDDPFFLRGADPEAVTGVKDPAFMARQSGDKNLPRYSEFLKTAQANLKTMADAGVKIGFGTDTGPPGRFSGFFEHWEMELMAEAGLKPAQIIQSFSANAAEYLGASKDLGTLEAGKWADFVVLARNPLDDIKNSRSIDHVYIAGVKVN